MAASAPYSPVMPRAPKVVDATALFEQRIRDGAYGLRGIPGERKLAIELGVSYMSARKAVQQLLAARLLIRTANGRLAPASRERNGQRNLSIAFVVPAFASPTLLDMQFQLTQVIEKHGGTARPITFSRASDPVIFEALDSDFDGLFFMLPVDASELLIGRLAREYRRVVVLWQDVSHLGIPSFLPTPARLVGKLLDHLQELGHRRIDCFNTLPHESTVDDRIRHWKMGLEQRGLQGTLHDFPTEAFQCSVSRAYDEFGRMLDGRGRDGGFNADAMFCVTSELGRGVARACHEHGVKLGSDLSVCGFSELNTARMMVPSLTTIPDADPKTYLEMGLEWILSHGEGWNRPLRLEPDDLPLFKGESTGPVRAS